MKRAGLSRPCDAIARRGPHPLPRDRYWDYPSQFSGGMMQRAMIVDAICAEHAVLNADNVTQPLDVTVAAQIVALMHDLCLWLKMAT